MKLYLETAHLRAMSHLAGKTDIREWINGVWVASPADRVLGSTMLVATTGAVLGVLRVDAIAEGEDVAGVDIFIPNRVLAPIVKMKGTVVLESVSAAPFTPTSAWQATSVTDGSSQRWSNQGEVMLDFRRAFPARPDGSPAEFNVEQMALFAKTAHDLGVKRTAAGFSVAITPNGESAALVEIDGYPSFVGVLQPLRTRPTSTGVTRRPPAWLYP